MSDFSVGVGQSSNADSFEAGKEAALEAPHIFPHH